MSPSTPARPDAALTQPLITVMEVGGPGEPSRMRPMTREEHREICEQLVLALLDAGVDVGAWKND